MTEVKVVTQVKIFFGKPLDLLEKEINEFCMNNNVVQIIPSHHTRGEVMIIYLKEIEVEIDPETGKRDIMYDSLRESIHSQVISMDASNHV